MGTKVPAIATTRELPANFCVYPWIGSYVATDGKIAPCCEFDGEIGNLNDMTLEEAWNSEKLAAIRAEFMAGRPLKACWKCFDREKCEGSSMRLEAQSGHQEWYKQLTMMSDDLESATPNFPVMLDLRFSNLCNFSCRSCWHGSSSSWFRDAKAIGATAGDRAEIRSFRKIDDVVAQIGHGLDDLEELYFAGGEPLMMEEHYALLETLVEHGRTDIRLRYNTNMSRTSFGGRSIFDLWSKFDTLIVHASVDASHAEGALLRNGFDWDQFVKNITQLKQECPNADTYYGVTVSALNILSLPQLFETLLDECGARPGSIHLHSLQEPDFYRTQILPAELKRKATLQIEEYIRTELINHEPDLVRASEFSRRLTGVASYMNSQDLSRLLPEFRAMMEKLDALRSQNSGEVLSRLQPVLGDTPHTSPFTKLLALFHRTAS